MHQLRNLMQIPQPPHHLSEHHPFIILGHGWPTISLHHVKEGPSGTVQCDDEIGIRDMDSRKEGKDMFVAEG
jgi:hypothetical protein